MADGISRMVVSFYICHRRLKYTVAESTNISSRSCRRRTSHLHVVHELDDCTHHIDSVFNDVVNSPTVPSLSVFQHLKRCPNCSFHLYLLFLFNQSNAMLMCMYHEGSGYMSMRFMNTLFNVLLFIIFMCYNYLMILYKL